MPVGGAPYSGDALHVHVFLIKQNFQTEAVMFSRREEMVIDFKSRFFLRTSVGAADIRKEIKTSIRRSLKKRTGRDNAFTRNDQRYFSVSSDDLGDPFRMFTLQRRHEL